MAIEKEKNIVLSANYRQGVSPFMIRNFLQRVMYGRYGGDQLNNFLLILYFVFWLLAIVTGVVSIVALNL